MSIDPTTRASALPLAIASALVIALLAGLGPAARDAHAWAPLDECAPIWDSVPTPYHVNRDGYSGLPLATLREVFELSFQEWNNPCCSSFSGAEQGLTDEVGEDGSNLQNVFSFREDSWPAELGDPNSVLAVTLTRWSQNPRTGRCSGLIADMVFNAANNTFDTRDGRGVVDLQAVTTHEVGHWLGLDHSRVNAATMWPTYSDEEQRSIHPDDTDGVCTLYPGECSCGSDADCDAGLECVGGTCVEPPCGSDADCAEGLECDEGECIAPPCRSDSDCPGAQVCDLASGECVIEADCPTCTPCTSDDDCGGRPWQCTGQGGPGVCTRICTQSEDCPGNSECFSVQGESFAVCLNDDANTAGICPEAYVCIDEDAACDGVVCDPGEVCDPTTGTCVSEDDCVVCDACTDDSQCAGGSCVSFGGPQACVLPCDSAADCPVNTICEAFLDGGGGRIDLCVNADFDANGFCPDDFACVDPCDTTECPVGWGCELGECIDPCDNVICPTGETCVEELGGCVELCEATECPEGWDCDEGVCIPPPTRGGDCDICDACGSDDDCDGVCLPLGDAGLVCTADCESAADCPGDSVCFDLPQAEGGTRSVCLNADASTAGVCAASYVCTEVETPGTPDGGGGTPGADAGPGEGGDDVGEAPAPDSEFPIFNSGSGGGCSAGGPTPRPWALVIVAGALLAVRHRATNSESGARIE